MKRNTKNVLLSFLKPYAPFYFSRINLIVEQSFLIDVLISSAAHDIKTLLYFISK